MQLFKRLREIELDIPILCWPALPSLLTAALAESTVSRQWLNWDTDWEKEPECKQDIFVIWSQSCLIILISSMDFWKNLSNLKEIKKLVA